MDRFFIVSLRSRAARLVAFFKAIRNHKLFGAVTLIYALIAWYVEKRWGDQVFKWIEKSRPTRPQMTQVTWTAFVFVAQNWTAFAVTGFLALLGYLFWQMWNESRPGGFVLNDQPRTESGKTSCDAERGPRLLLEVNSSQRPPTWTITNSGETDAVNIESDDIESYSARVKIEFIQRLGVGQSVAPQFRTWSHGQLFGRSRHPNILIEAVKKGAESTTNSMEEYMGKVSHNVIPVRLLCIDPAGNQWESLSEIHWNLVLDRGGIVRHIKTRRI